MRAVGWALDYKRFRKYLEDKYQIGNAYIFIGYVESNQNLYDFLKRIGYVCIFKETIADPAGNVKGNCDVDLTLQAMIDLPHYKKALIVTSDGDFYPLAQYLEHQGKFAGFVSPKHKHCSRLLTKRFPQKILYLDGLRSKLEYIKKHP